MNARRDVRVGLRGSASDLLLERDDELEQLAVMVAAAREGTGGVGVVDGGAGVGKSTLLDVAAGLAADAGTLVLRARGSEIERELSFGVIVQLFAGWLHEAEPRVRASAMAGAARLATPVIEGEHWSESHGHEEQPGSPAVIHGLFWLLVNISELRPVLLVVDDLHWCDPPSLQTLLYACQRLEELPVALLVARRPDEPATDRLVAELAAHRLARRITLAPLSEGAVARLLARHLGAEPEADFVQACAIVTGGNPFLTCELARSLSDDALEPSDANAGRIAALRPSTVTQQVLVRIARLGPDADAVASAVAVLGDGSPRDLIGAVAECERGAVSSALDALAADGILVPLSPARFAHPLVRATIYDQLAQGRRSEMHLRAASVLRSRGASAEIVAAHLLACGPGSGQPWTAEVLRTAAASELAAGNPGSAVRALEYALAEPLGDNQRATVLLELAGAESLAGDDRALAHINQAMAGIDHPALRATACQQLGDTLLARGERYAAARAFERGLSELEDRSDPAADRLRAGYFTAASMDPELASVALAHHEGMLDSSPKLDTPATRGVLAALAAHLVMAGAPRAQPLALAERAWAGGALLHERGPDAPSWSLVSAAFAWADELECARQVIEAVLEDARRRGMVMAFATASYCLQLPTYRSGDLAGARAHGEAVLDARERYGWAAYVATATGVHADVLIDQDELGAAERVLQTLSEHSRDEGPLAPGLCARGRLRLLQGDTRAALADFLHAGAVFSALGVENPSTGAWRMGAILALHRLGDDGRARAQLEALQAIAQRTGTPTHGAQALRAEAALASGSAAVELLMRAAESLDGTQDVVALLHCRAELGGALRRTGERVEARATLTTALEQARRFRAWRIHRLVHEELKLAGARPRRLAFSGAESMTAGELRVARMAAQGMTNREIAEALFVTPRTVEQHLYNSYKKLGIRSRAELGPLVGRVAS